MAHRRGLGIGKGRGYKNIIGQDPRVHSDSARGRKQPQMIKSMMADYKKVSKIPIKYIEITRGER